MRKCIIFLLVAFMMASNGTIAQRKESHKPAAIKPPSPQSPKKYSSLLWEITGNGLNKPSYLFGTMHVSDKLVFHLGDSFYNAIRKVNVVALENNPEHWQDDFSSSVFFRRQRGGGLNSLLNRQMDMPYDQMRITSFAIDDYEEALKASLSVEPSMINGMMYRTYGTQMDDFEEDTFLDMYIFQVGKKLGKKLTGVENFEESEKLVMEAYRDMIKDRNKKKKSFDYEGMMTNPKKIEEAYRKGDLDMLDSLESMTVFSDAFQEKFLYKRNEIQAHSIDTILKKNSLFVGVGAAHLPGKRGVIEMLRKMGYSLRPVSMDERNSQQKEAIDKLRPKSNFSQQTSDDGFFKVSIPGKNFYRFTEWSGLDVVQYADMVNGAYYVVTRIKTDALIWGHSTDLIHKKIDSLLYENIPGKILKKIAITKNGYKGWDITNRTRRGDYQRYQIFVTPFEVIIFKMSGNGEYVQAGDEAQQFFSSIQLKEFDNTNWVTYQPPTGGFSIQLPHAPFLLKDDNYGADRLEYAAFDKQGNSYLIMKMNLHNYNFIEEDSFDLNLMNESYRFSPFIDKMLSREFVKVSGYPALHCIYRHKDGSFSSVKYIIRGPVYYTIIARYKKDNAEVNRFSNSFSITPFIYPEVKKRVDTLLHYKVNSPEFVKKEKKNDRMKEMEDLLRMAYEDDLDDNTSNYTGAGAAFQTRYIGNDTIGEKIFVAHIRLPEYSFEKDTSRLWKSTPGGDYDGDSTFIFRVNRRYELPNGMKCREVQVTDTGSSRLIIAKMFYKNGHLFTISSLTDTLSKKSAFIDNFFGSFMPDDTLKGASIYTRKTEQFFKDYFSKDSLIAKKARKALYQMEFDSLDVPYIEKAIVSLDWSVKNYLAVKKHLIGELGDLKDSSVVPFLRGLYIKVGDTSELQNTILNALVQQRTKAGFIAFRDLILQEPPIRDNDADYTPPVISRLSRVRMAKIVGMPRMYLDDGTDYGNWPDLYDTLALTKVIFPDFLQLINVDDYKEDVMRLLRVMVDSGFLKANDYEQYFSKLYLDARQLQKKQLAKEGQEDIQKAIKKDRPSYSADNDDDDEMNAGNTELDKYAVLLMPFWEKNPGIPNFFGQLMKTKDRRLLYNTFILMLRNKKPVADSLFEQYARSDEYRAELYGDLKKMKMLDKFPARYKTQLDITKSILLGAVNNYNRMDTIVYLDKLPVSYKNKNGYVYFFKYKKMRDDTYWQLASAGMQPEKQDDIDIDNDDFTEYGEGHKLENDKPVKEQLQDMMKELLYSKHDGAASFYEARSYSFYKNYLSDMVKGSRYKD